MRIAVLTCILGIYPGFVLPSPAQISTFPAPPSLPPSSHSSPIQTTNSPAGMPGPVSDPTATPVNPGQPAQNSSPADSTAIPVTAATLSSMSALDDKIPLTAGDRISFRVIEDRDDAVPRIVTDTGEVDFPYTGRLKVEGLTCRQVAVQLKRLLEVDYYKRATVIIGLDIIAPPPLVTNHELAWIVGQVRQVGAIELIKDHPMTVSQLILRAGGFGDFADQRKVRLLHRAMPAAGGDAATPPASAEVTNAQEGQTIDVKAVFEGQSTLDPVVKSNDLIVVPKRLVNF